VITEQQLRECLPLATDEAVYNFAPAIAAAMEEFDISNAARAAGFIAQCGHESGNLKYVKENLNYSAQGLAKTFPKYFNASNAEAYGRKPEAIANRVYANRMGNGPEESGDGWAFRGRGLIQLTGRDNYRRCGEGLGVDLLSDPTYLETHEGAARSAAWFWKSHGLNEVADRHDVLKMTKIINGGTIGLEERKHNFEHALSVLNG